MLIDTLLARNCIDTYTIMYKAVKKALEMIEKNENPSEILKTAIDDCNDVFGYDYVPMTEEEYRQSLIDRGINLDWNLFLKNDSE